MRDGYTNYEWFLKNDFNECAGQWLAIVDKEIVAYGKNVKKVIQQTKEKQPNKKQFITKVRDKSSIL